MGWFIEAVKDTVTGIFTVGQRRRNGSHSRRIARLFWSDAMTLTEFFEEHYLPMNPGLSAGTIKLYHLTIKKFGRFLDRQPTLDDLTDQRVGKFMRFCAERGNAPRTVNKERCNLLSMWNLSHKMGVTSRGPLVGKFKVATRVPTSLAVSDVRALLVTCARLQGNTGAKPNSTIMRAFVAIQWATGERSGAVALLKWVDVTGDVLTFRANTRKGGRRAISRKVPKWVMKLILELDVGTSPFLFPGLSGTNKTKINKLYKRLFKRAGVSRPKGKMSHLLRSTHATMVHKAGGNATESLGHASASTTWDSYLDPRKIDNDFAKFLPDLGFDGGK